MTDKSKEEMDELKQLNEAFLKDIGYEHMNAVCDEADRIIEKYKDIEVPNSLDQWFKGYMAEQMKEKQRVKRKKSIVVMSKRAVAIIIISITALSAVTFSVDAFRIKFFNMILDTKEKFGLVFYEEKQTEQEVLIPENWSGYYMTYLPKGNTLLDYEQGASISRLTYINGDGIVIELLQGSMISSSQIDTEDAAVLDVEINGNQGVLVVKDGEIIIGWSEKNSSLLLRGNLDKSTILKIAKSIKEKK